MTEDRGQMTEDRGQMTEARGQRTDAREQKADDLSSLFELRGGAQRSNDRK
ncbi:hypothetical protein D1AOALGA4SA_389 [Olavius algarvensis Delta 1 endosymbiont]|nr:hypothetical protein D1AOALGA4SA_389 [Olavius algarvensis Delta 1 endosymbiont]